MQVPTELSLLCIVSEKFDCELDGGHHFDGWESRLLLLMQRVRGDQLRQFIIGRGPAGALLDCSCLVGLLLAASSGGAVA